MRSTLAGLSLLLLAAPSHAAYSLKKSYSGSTFFDSWTYYGNYDVRPSGLVISADGVELTLICTGRCCIEFDEWVSGAPMPWIMFRTGEVDPRCSPSPCFI